MKLAIGAQRSRWPHAFFAALAALAAIGFACLPVQLAPAPGLVELSEATRVPVPGGHVNAAGGNYFHEGASLSIDTRLGEYSLGVVYNSAWGWTFGVDASYKNGDLRDVSGARIPLAALADGAAAPGTHWVKLDAARAKTKGGLVHEFDPLTGRLAAMYWSSAPYPRLQFVPVQLGAVTRTERIEQCTSASACTLTFSLTHDSSGRIVRIADRAGRSALFAYDASGRLAASRDGLDVARGWPGERYEYAGNFLAAIVNSEGERIEIASDAAGRATQLRAVGAGDPTWRFTYGFVNATSVATTTSTDPLGHATTFAIDTLHRVQSIANPLGERTAFTWSGQRPASRTLPDGTATRWTWADDDIATQTLPSGNVRRFSYAPGAVNRERPNARALAELRDTIGLVERRGYDAQGRVTSVENGAGEATTFRYAADETLARIELPGGATTHFDATGEHGHPTRVSLDGVAWKDLALDVVGNALTGARPSPYSGGVAQVAYDEDRNPSTYFVRDHPDGAATPTTDAIALEYRSDRQLTRVARPYGGEITWLRDALGRVTELRERVSPSATPANAWSVTRYEYDLAGRTLAVERANGMRSETAYDAAGRVARQRATRHGVVEREVEFEYAQGRLARAHSPTGGFDEQLAYDASGQASAVRHTLGETTRVARDVRGRTVSVAFEMPDGAPLVTLTSAYDEADRELSVAALGVDVVRRTYRGGRISERTYGNGVQVTSHALWPGLGVESARDVVNAMGPVAHCGSDVSAGFDAALVADDCTVFPLQPLKGDLTQRYGYASSTQPIGADRRLVSSQVSTGQAHFTYDHLSNVSGSTLFEYLPPWSAIFQKRSVGFNAEHNRALTTRDENPVSPATWQHAYDEAGFETSRTTASAQGGAKTTTFAWTATGRVAQIATNGVVDAGFAYDALGRRASITRSGYTRHWRFGGVVEFAFTGAPLWIDLGEVAINPLGYHRYRVPDARGNTQFVFDYAGALVHTATYGAYGEALTRGQANSDFGFARGTHIATGAGEFVWLGERLLDPRTGRFNSPDPVWNPINAYAYTFGNPVEFWDESGRHPGHAGGLDQHRQIALAEIARNEAFQIAAAAIAIASISKSPATVGAAIAAIANASSKQNQLDILRDFHELEFPVELPSEVGTPPDLGGFEFPAFTPPLLYIPFYGTPTVTIEDLHGCFDTACVY